MGSVCCVAAREKNLPHRTSTQSSIPRAYSRRDIRCSPSWSFRWDSRSRIENSADNYVQFHRDLSVSHSGNMGSEIKCGISTETLSDGGSPLQNFQTPIWPKSPMCSSITENLTACASDLNSSLSLPSNLSTEEKYFTKSSGVAETDTADLNLSNSAPSGSSSSPSKIDPLSSESHLIQTDPTPSRKTRQSPRHLLARQASDGQIPAVKSLNDCSVSEGRQSFVLSVCSNDLTLGSQGGSSDGWSMRTFSELVASSQRERWSFDSDNAGSSHGKITRSNSQQFSSSLTDLQTCGICLKLLVERPSWVNLKIITSNEVSVVAVLVCGHVYHAECLESTTPETNRYDPSCPLCMGARKSAVQISPGKALGVETDPRARNKISRIGVADSDLDGNSVSNRRKSTGHDGKGPKMASSSSMKSSFGRPFFRRHFSVGSKSTQSLSENDSTRRKGFWARYRKD